MRIAIDIDSTLAQSWDLLAEAALTRYQVILDYESQTEWTGHPLTEEQFEACVTDSHTEESILRAQPYPDAVTTIARWHANGHEIYVLSHRSSEAARATACWLDRIGCCYDGLWCGPEKVARCLELEVELLVDDAPSNVERALERGLLAAMIRHPWNSRCWRLQGVTTGADWIELAARLERVLEPC